MEEMTSRKSPHFLPVDFVNIRKRDNEEKLC